MRSKLKINKWKVSAFLVIVIFFVLGYFLISFINNELKEDTLNYLSEIAKQGANLVETKVDDQMHTLEAVSATIETGGNFDPNFMINAIKPEAERNEIKRMGIIMPDGQAITTDGLSLDLSYRDYFKQAMTGVSAVSDTLVDPNDGMNINVYSTPIFNDTQIVGILFATVETENLKQLLGVSTFSGQGYSFVVKANGDVVAESLNPNSLGAFNNIFETLENAEFSDKSDLETLEKKMSQTGSGSFTSVNGGQQWYVNYEPLSINDWYIMSVVPTDVVNIRSINIIRFAYMLIATGLVAILILFGIILVSQNRTKKNLKKIAYTDEVTGGNNWNKFQVESHKILEVSQEKEYALIFLDINGFRFINEKYGHVMGNVLLTRIMEILKTAVGKYEAYGRVTADFFIILTEKTTKNELIQYIKNLSQSISCKKSELGIKEKISCNFGVYEINDNTENMDQMREKANMARIEAKTGTGEIWFFYSEKFRKEIAREKEIEDQMEEALENNEFEMYLQPKFNLHTNAYCGAEALARWNRPGKGLVLPKDFIPIFERTGFVTNLDMYMVEETCKALKHWKEKGYPQIMVSVNISRKNLWLDNFISEMLRITDQYQINRQCLEIELTESCVFEDINQVIETGKKLQSHGFAISMDDFGSGYSSINLLATLPLNTIKLDQEFFKGNLQNERQYFVVQGLIDLVKKLGMTVVAEGIQERVEVDILRDIDCDIIQGSYFGNAMPVQEFEKLVFKTETIR